MSELKTEFTPKPLTEEQSEVIKKLIGFAGGADKVTNAEKELFEQSVRWCGKQATLKTLDFAERLMDENALKGSPANAINKLIKSMVYPKLNGGDELLKRITSIAGQESSYYQSYYRRAIKDLGVEKVSFITDNIEAKKAEGKIENPEAYMKKTFNKVLNESFWEKVEAKREERSDEQIAQKLRDLAKEEHVAQRLKDRANEDQSRESLRPDPAKEEQILQKLKSLMETGEVEAKGEDQTKKEESDQILYIHEVKSLRKKVEAKGEDQTKKEQIDQKPKKEHSRKSPEVAMGD
jgi:hypothetical protein